MVQENESSKVGQEPVLNEQIQRRLDMFEQRLDNIDSMLTAVVQRVMSQPIALNITCSKCGHNIEIALVAVQKPTK